MRPVVSALSLLAIVASVPLLSGCDGCGANKGMSAAERNQTLASAIASPPPAPSTKGAEGIGHAANVIPGQGPKRIEHQAPRMGMPFSV